MNEQFLNRLFEASEIITVFAMMRPQTSPRMRLKVKGSRYTIEITKSPHNEATSLCFNKNTKNMENSDSFDEVMADLRLKALRVKDTIPFA